MLSQEKFPLVSTLSPASMPNSRKPESHSSQLPFNKEFLRFRNFCQYDDQNSNNLPVESKPEDSPTLQLTQHSENWPLYLVERLFPSPPKDPSCIKLKDSFCFTSKLYVQSQPTQSQFITLQDQFQYNFSNTIIFPAPHPTMQPP